MKQINITHIVWGKTIPNKIDESVLNALLGFAEYYLQLVYSKTTQLL